MLARFITFYFTDMELLFETSDSKSSAIPKKTLKISRICLSDIIRIHLINFFNIFLDKILRLGNIGIRG